MFTFATVVVALFTTTQAANDWSVPCTNRSCSYDFAGNEKTAPTSMLINGPHQILSDITPAAGWLIMDCSPTWSNGSHAIRMVCAGTPQQTAHCSHLDDNGGAPNTVVRLPENCGIGPFAHVNRTFTPTNQSVPFNVTRQGGSSPNVRGLILDYNFESIPESRGTLNLSLAASNVNSPTPVRKRGRSRVYTRAAPAAVKPSAVKPSAVKPSAVKPSAVKSSAVQPSVVKPLSAAKPPSTSSAVKSSVVTPLSTVKPSSTSSVVTPLSTVKSSSTSSAVNSVNTAVSSTASSAAPAASTSESLKSTSIPIKLNNQSFTLVDASVKCTSSQGNLAGSANLKIDVDANIDAAVTFGYTFSGSIVPLKILDLSMSASLTGQALATFHIESLAQGTYDTGSLALFKSGLPGLTIPGIITLGPTFSINSLSGLTGVEFGAAASITTDTKFPNLQFTFPQSKTPESVLPQTDANSFQLSVSNPSVDFKGQLSGHIVPRFDFGVSLGTSNAATAAFFMNIDLSGTAELQFRAGVAAAQAAKAASVAPAASPAVAAAATPAAAVARRAIPVNGCVNVRVGVDINAGVIGSIPGIASKSQTFPLFSASKPLFTKCVGTGFSAPAPAAPAPSARGISGGSTIARAARYASLEVERRAAAPPLKITPPKAAPPTVGSPTASGEISQSTNPAINLLKPQKSTASTTQLDCANVQALSSLIKVF